MAHRNRRLDSHLVTLTSPGSFAAEQYQGLRLTIERLGRNRTLQVIAVTSPAAGEGKTLTAINLAGALARGSDDARVLLIDADLRRPAVGRQLAIEDVGGGLAEVVGNAAATLDGVTQKLPTHNLSVIPAGTRTGAVHHILRSPRLDLVLAEARRRYDFIVLDTPPLLPVFDSALLANSVDGVLMVVAANQTPRKLLGEALNLLDPAKVLGIVFNRDARPMFGYYDAYYKDYFPDVSRVATGA
jgi:capsular exopolysaccharide synthesis family protein